MRTTTSGRVSAASRTASLPSHTAPALSSRAQAVVTAHEFGLAARMP
ncbi:hypothetical protein ACIQZO_04045 [Streptomyces sp. NPDC097617]